MYNNSLSFDNNSFATLNEFELYSVDGGGILATIGGILLAGVIVVGTAFVVCATTVAVAHAVQWCYDKITN